MSYAISADSCCNSLAIMQPPAHFESTETSQRGLQRSLIFPIVHLRRLQVAMVFSITRTA
jgi:hypothetical protein